MRACLCAQASGAAATNDPNCEERHTFQKDSVEHPAVQNLVAGLSQCLRSASEIADKQDTVCSSTKCTCASVSFWAVASTALFAAGDEMKLEEL